MDEIELTRLMKELMRLLPHMPSSEVEEGGIDERVEAIKKRSRTQSQPAKRVEKMWEKQFAPYMKEVERLDAQKISAIIEGRTENTLTNVPIPALIWFAVRNGGQDKEFETMIFAAIHMKANTSTIQHVYGCHDEDDVNKT